MHTQHTHNTHVHTIHTPHTTHMYTQHALHTCIQHAHNTHRHTHNTHTCTPRPSHTPALCMHTYPHTLYDPHVHSTHTPLAAGPWAWGHHRAKHRLCVRLLVAAPLSSWCCCFHRQANRLGGVSDLPRASGPTDLVGRTQSPHSRTSLSCILGPETVALVHSGSAFSGIFSPKPSPMYIHPEAEYLDLPGKASGGAGSISGPTPASVPCRQDETVSSFYPQHSALAMT